MTEATVSDVSKHEIQPRGVKPLIIHYINNLGQIAGLSFLAKGIIKFLIHDTNSSSLAILPIRRIPSRLAPVKNRHDLWVRASQ